MSEFPVVSPGQDVAGMLFSSRWINHVTHRSSLGDLGGGEPGRARPAGLTLDVLNDTGSAITVPFPILRLTDPVISIATNANVPFNEPQFKGATPDAETAGSFVVVQGPLASGAARRAVLMGLAWCKVQINSADDTHATAIDGDNTKLTSGVVGVPIKWKESGTGEKWALVLLGGPDPGVTIILGRAKGAVDAGDSEFEADNIELVSGIDPRDDPSSSTEVLEISNLFGFTIDDNGRFEAKQMPDGTLYASQAECPA